MGNESNFPDFLQGRLWHTTHPDRYQQILKSGAILPNPLIPDNDRWKTSRGPHYFPYVRTLGAVSLFDFDGFDPASYSTNYPISSWREFVPYRRTWGASVWIEIDRHAVADKFMTAEQLRNRLSQENAHRHTLMPKIEVAYLGPIPISAFLCAFDCRADRPNCQIATKP